MVLAERGNARVERSTVGGLTALHLAAKKGNLACVVSEVSFYTYQILLRYYAKTIRLFVLTVTVLKYYFVGVINQNAF